jgi:hypothetical protein
MDAALMMPVRVNLPYQPPKIVRKEQLPDQRKITPVPLRAFSDRTLTISELRFLGIMCSYANKGGLLWASLKRMGLDMSVSHQRAQQLAAKLERKGYTKTLYKGFAGERAATRQIIFNPEATLADIIAKTQAPAPYMLEQQAKQAKRRGRPPKNKQVEQLQSSDNAQPVEQPMSGMHRLSEIDELKAKVSSRVWDLAVLRVGNSTDYLALKQAITKLLR